MRHKGTLDIMPRSHLKCTMSAIGRIWWSNAKTTNHCWFNSTSGNQNDKQQQI